MCERPVCADTQANHELQADLVSCNLFTIHVAAAACGFASGGGLRRNTVCDRPVCADTRGKLDSSLAEYVRSWDYVCVSESCALYTVHCATTVFSSSVSGLHRNIMCARPICADTQGNHEPQAQLVSRNLFTIHLNSRYN